MSSEYKEMMNKLQKAVDKANKRHGHVVYKIETYAGRAEVLNIRDCESAPATNTAEALAVLTYLEHYAAGGRNA